MDPITSIVTALALGAASALKDTAAQAVKDSYAGLKSLIQRKYSDVGAAQLEKAPASQARRDVVAEDLSRTAAAHDPELLKSAQSLLEAVQRHAPEAAGAIGVDLHNIKAASLHISDILASGTGVSVKDADVAGDFEIRGVRAGFGPQAPKV